MRSNSRVMAKAPSAKAILDRIDRRRKALGLSDNAASQRATGSRDTLRTLKRNVRDGLQRGISTETVQKFAAALRTTEEWLLREVGPETIDLDMRSEDVALSLDPKPPRMVKVKGYVGAGGRAHYYAVDPGDLGEIEGTERDTDNTVAVVIIGSSLGKFFEGWHVLYDDVRSPVTADLIGELCVVGLADDRILIKKIQRDGRGRFNLISNAENEPPIPNVKIEWAAKVTDLRRA